MRVNDIWSFIQMREAVRIGKEKGVPRPWTADPILSTYRFCNVHRENDRVTKELAPLIRSASPDAWFHCTIGRLLNNPGSVAEVVKPGNVTWNMKGFVETLHKRRDRDHKIFNAAYIVSTNGIAMDKILYIASRVLDPLWKMRGAVRPLPGDTLDVFHKRLMKFDGLGSFIAGQIVGDLKFCAGYLNNAPDWWTWAASGPGSRRGLNRVMDLPKETSWDEMEWRSTLRELHVGINKKVGAQRAISKISAQDLQNCLCEFDKYERARTGEGTPKQLYREHHIRNTKSHRPLGELP